MQQMGAVNGHLLKPQVQGRADMRKSATSKSTIRQ